MKNVAQIIDVWGVSNAEIMECLPPIISTTVMLIKYLNGVFRVKKLRQACDMINSDHERLMGLREYDVLHAHAMEGRKFLIQFLGALIVLVGIYLTLPTVMIINDVINNVTQNRYMMYPVNYVFIDASDGYAYFVLHSYIASLFIPYILYSLDSLYITFTQHACAMFAVVGYRLKTMHIVNTVTLKKEFHPSKYEELLVDEQMRMYNTLILCVKEHKRAIECTQIVQSAFSATLFFQISLNIVLLSITGVQALLKLSDGSFTDVARLVIWMAGDHLHLFFLYLPGQRLLDFSTQVYFDALECKWHKCCRKSRVICQILVMRSLSPFKLTALKITTLNMESFLSVTQTAVSYFTVLSSTI